MDVFGVVVNIVLIALTAVVVYFAWQTVRQAQAAGTAAGETIASLKEVVAAMNEAATLMARSAKAAHKTAAIARAAREQAEYDRKLRALMDVEAAAWIGGLLAVFIPLSVWRYRRMS